MSAGRFNERKTTEAAAILLKLAGGRMNIVKLLKLLYLADRRALDRWERPITNDAYCSMDQGPILSITYDIIKQTAVGVGEVWYQTISERDPYHKVTLLKNEKPQKLSPAEVEVLYEVYEEFGPYDTWTLVSKTHELPEYTSPSGSSIPIPLGELLAVLGYLPEDIDRIIRELAEEASLDTVIQN